MYDLILKGDEQAVKEIFCNPNVPLGQSDAGAYLANANPGFGYATIMPASLFGIHDRGLLRRSMVADVGVFDPEKINLAETEKVEDLPEGAPRYIQRSKGIHYTIVNGSVLMKNGVHMGVYPGKVLLSV